MSRQEGLRESLARTVYGIIAYEKGWAASLDGGRSLWDAANRQTKVAYRLAVAPYATCIGQPLDGEGPDGV